MADLEIPDYLKDVVKPLSGGPEKDPNVPQTMETPFRTHAVLSGNSGLAGNPNPIDWKQARGYETRNV